MACVVSGYHPTCAAWLVVHTMIYVTWGLHDVWDRWVPRCTDGMWMGVLVINIRHASVSIGRWLCVEKRITNCRCKCESDPCLPLRRHVPPGRPNKVFLGPLLRPLSSGK